MSEIHEFILGAVVMASTIAGLLFVRSWRKTRDRLFLFFAIAFWLLGLNWVLLAFITPTEMRPALYLLRLLAFVLILIGIVDKNRSGRMRG